MITLEGSEYVRKENRIHEVRVHVWCRTDHGYGALVVLHRWPTQELQKKVGGVTDKVIDKVGDLQQTVRKIANA